MQIEHKTELVTLVDYEFKLRGGVPLGVTINAQAGDTIEMNANAIVFHIAPKTLPNDAEAKTPVRELAVYREHILAYERTERQVLPMTRAQQEEITKLYKEAYAVR